MNPLSALILSVSSVRNNHTYTGDLHLSISSDGTTNFVHGFPFVCISLGLIYKKRPVLGVIFNPFLDHLVSFLQSSKFATYTKVYSTRVSKDKVHTLRADSMRLLSSYPSRLRNLFLLSVKH